MQIDESTSLLGGLSPAAFMRRHWQKKPLLVRAAIADPLPVDRAGLFDMAASDGVESRLVQRDGAAWRLRQGPFSRRALPALSRRDWTLLVQGVDLHSDRAHALLRRFDFLPNARLDDLMVSYASDGGGVGPHFDSYDVFLLQARGRRHWAIGRQSDLRLQAGLPLKILARFEPEQSFVLEPGDMLYLPPRWAHEGVAVGGDCITCSIGLRAPAAHELAADVLARLADAMADETSAAMNDPAASKSPASRVERRYRDPEQQAIESCGAIPPTLAAFARQSLADALARPQAVEQALGESLSEPKPGVWFDEGKGPIGDAGLRLDRRSRMLYDARHVFLNGESFRAAGRDARLMRRLADRRVLLPAERVQLSPQASALVNDWCEAGWLHGE